MKVCNSCKREKPLAEFAKVRVNKDGYSGRCRSCVNERKRRWYADMSEDKLSEYRHVAKRWKKENPEKRRDSEVAKRARGFGSEGSHTASEWLELCERYHFACLGCGDTNKLLTRDHVVPLSQGGTNYIDNIQPLCQSCNSKKKDKAIDYRDREL